MISRPGDEAFMQEGVGTVPNAFTFSSRKVRDTTMQEKLNTFMKRVKSMRTKFQEEGKALLKGTMADMFAQFPQLRRIEWYQYTPYFNDGDACIFGVCDPDFYVVSQEALDCSEREKAAHDAKQAELVNLSDEQRKTLGVDFEEWEEPDTSKFEASFCGNSWRADDHRAKFGAELVDAATAFGSFVTSSEAQPVLEDVFGDHAKVTATKDGVEVEEYEHD